MHKPSMLALLVLLLCFPSATLWAAGEAKDRLIVTVKASPDSTFYSALELSWKGFSAMLGKSRRTPLSHIPPELDTALRVQGMEGETAYLIDHQGNLIDPKRGQLLLLPEPARNRLIRYRNFLRAHHFGEMIPWKEAKDVIPRKAVFVITDLETGLKLKVQRRAGSRHADVQPLTKEDTRILKEIYRGKWSWDRRAILAEAGGRQLAASMHGMPHGAGAIRDNDFPGHFCVHFFESTTHGSKRADPGHQAMVAKAAGKLNEFLLSASPYQMVDLFLLALNQNDPHLLRMTVHPHQLAFAEELMAKYRDAETVRRLSRFEEKDTAHLLSVEIPADVQIYRPGKGLETTTFLFRVTRTSFGDGWKLDLFSSAVE